jgi:hypothetical protein
MKTPVKSISIGALGSAAWLLLSAGNLIAQDRAPQGNFGPGQMRQPMLERMRGQFEVKDDAEWKAISARIEKVMQARRSLGGVGGPGGFGFPGGRGGPNGPGGRGFPGGPPMQRGQGGPPPQGGPGGPDSFGPPGGAPPPAPEGPDGRPPGAAEFRNAPGVPGGPGRFGPEASPELDALRKAINRNASAEEIKTKLAEVREARKKKEAELEKAQDELRATLSPRQEAVAVTLGLLK